MQRRPRAAAVRGKRSTPTISCSQLESEEAERTEDVKGLPPNACDISSFHGATGVSVPEDPDCAITAPSTNTDIDSLTSAADSERLRASSDDLRSSAEPSLQRRPRAAAFRAGKTAPQPASTSPSVPLKPSESSNESQSSDAEEVSSSSSSLTTGNSTFALASDDANAASDATVPAKDPSLQRRPRAVAVRAGKHTSQPTDSSTNTLLKSREPSERSSPSIAEVSALLADSKISSALGHEPSEQRSAQSIDERIKQSGARPISCGYDPTSDPVGDNGVEISQPFAPPEIQSPQNDPSASSEKFNNAHVQVVSESSSHSLEDEKDAEAVAHAEIAQYATILDATSTFEHNYGVDGIENAEGSFVGDGDDEEDQGEDPMVSLLSGGYSLGYDAMRKHQSKQNSSIEVPAPKGNQQALLDGVAGPLGTTSNAAQHAGTTATLPTSCSESRHHGPMPQQTQRPPARLSPQLTSEDVDKAKKFNVSSNLTGVSAAEEVAAVMNTVTLAGATANNTGSNERVETGDASDELLAEDGASMEAWPTEPAELAVHFAALLGEGVNVIAALVEPDGDTLEMGVGLREVTLVLSTSATGSNGGGRDGSERNTEDATVTQQLVVYDAASVEEYYTQVEARAAERHNDQENFDADEYNEVEQPKVLYAVDFEEVLFVLENHQTPALEPFRTLCVDGTYSDVASSRELLFAPDRCCSLVGLDFSLDLICADTTERSALVAGLAALLGFKGEESKNSSGSAEANYSQGRILSKMNPKSGAAGAGAASALVGVVLEGLRAALGLPDLQESNGDNKSKGIRSPGRNSGSRKRNVNYKSTNDDDGSGNGGGGNSDDDGTTSTVSGATSVASSKAEARRQRLLKAAAATSLTTTRNGSQRGFMSTVSPRSKGDAFSDDGNGDGVASTVSAATSIVSADAMAQRQRLANAATAFTFAIESDNNPSSSALTTTARALPNGEEQGPSLAEDAIGSLVQQLEAATVEVSDSENGSGVRKYRAQSSGLGSSVQSLRAAGPMDGPDGGETVCRRCNGDEPLGSGLFMRCEGCFDWFHPECVSALRRMQVETLLALQRWICRRCYQRSKRYKDLKTFQRSEKSSSHRSSGRKASGRSKGGSSRSSSKGRGGGSSSGSSGSESSGGGQAARALAARKRPQLSLGAELTKLLPDAPTASGLGKPRFIRWAHKCSDHACQIGHNEKLIGDAVRNYCVECRVPDDSAPGLGGSDGNKKGRSLVEAGAVDWSGVALDALAALYYAPAATTRLLASRAVQSIVIRPGQKFVATWLPALLNPDTVQAFLDPTQNKGQNRGAKHAGSRGSSRSSNSSRRSKKGRGKRRQRRKHEGSDGDEVDDGGDEDRPTSAYSAYTGTTNTTSNTANSSVASSSRTGAGANAASDTRRGTDGVSNSSAGSGGEGASGAISTISSLPWTLVDGAASFFTDGLPFLASDRNSRDKSNAKKGSRNHGNGSGNRSGNNISDGSGGEDDDDDDHASMAVSAKDSAKVSARAARAAAMSQDPSAKASPATATSVRNAAPTPAAARAAASHLGSASDNYTETSDYDSSSMANPSTLPPRTASRVRNRRPPAGRATMSSAPPLSKSGPPPDGLQG